MRAARRRARPRRPGCSAGYRRPAFTIVELLIVIVILGLVAAFAAPRIDVTRFKVNSAVQALGTTILTAQRQAVTQQHDIIVTFDSAALSLRIHEDRNNNGTVDAGEHVRSVRLGESVVFGRGSAPAYAPLGADGVVFTKKVGGLPAVVFHRDGSASEAGGFYVTSVVASRGSDRPTDARVVTVERATGRASWLRYGANGWVKLF